MNRSITYTSGASLAVAVLAAVSAAGCASTPPPEREMAVARASIERAVPEAERHAPQALRLARAKLEQAEQAMAGEEYEKARRLAEEAIADARLAQVTARSERAQMAAAEINESLRTLRKELGAQQEGSKQ